MGAIFILPASETMLRKDLSSGAHRLSTWFLINTSIAALPGTITITLNLSICYWMAGLADDFTAYVLFALMMPLLILMYQSVGLVLSIVFPTKADIVAMLIMSYQFIFSGIFVPISESAVPELAYTNPIYYAECILTRIIYLDGRTYTPTDYDPSTGTPTLITKEQALARYSLKTSACSSAGILIALLVCFRVGAFVLLRRKFRKVLFTHQPVDAQPSCLSCMGSLLGSPPSPMPVLVTSSMETKEADSIV
mmetsp:Transcript_20806/g.46587  ORF Transcript_20806/g.46587 Transcript_20806/m.46587 type:complete len:251 (-) Transcript_20806:294-1046(-)